MSQSAKAKEEIPNELCEEGQLFLISKDGKRKFFRIIEECSDNEDSTTSSKGTSPTDEKEKETPPTDEKEKETPPTDEKEKKTPPTDAKKKKKKDPNAPKKANTAYNIFMKNNGKGSSKGSREVCRAKWDALSKEDRSQYEESHMKEKMRYEKELLAYNKRTEAEECGEGLGKGV